ncbi:MAG: hypothetical protein NTZ32_11395 [Planctomycetales bacterium]|nr:hypothetical protein [Planctomycetales bacterium]
MISLDQKTLSNEDAVECLRDRFSDICDGFLEDAKSAAHWWTEIVGFPASTDGHLVQVTAAPEHVALFLQPYIEGTLQSNDSACLAELWRTLFSTDAQPVSGVVINQEEAHG